MLNIHFFCPADLIYTEFCVCLQMYVSLLFWYQFFCGFSGSVMTNSWVLILFNLVFTSAPPLIYSILDQDIAAAILLKLPELYKTEQKCKVTEGMAADRIHVISI